MSPIPPPPFSGHTNADPTSVMGRRMAAYAIDVLIGWAAFALAFAAVGDSFESELDLCGFEESPELCFHAGETIYFAEGADAAVVVLSGIGVWFLMGILVQGLAGGTPGKLLVGLRVVAGDSGAPAGIARCAARTAMWVVDAFPFLFPLVGLITGVSSSGHRRVGDMVANTVVVAKDHVGRPAMAGGARAVPLGGWAPPTAATGSAWAPPTGGATGWAAPSPPTAGAPFPEDPAVFDRPRTGATPAPPRADAIPSTAPTPQWDAGRNAWILWDAAQGRWLAHDTATNHWRPL